MSCLLAGMACGQASRNQLAGAGVWALLQDGKIAHCSSDASPEASAAILCNYGLTTAALNCTAAYTPELAFWSEEDAGDVDINVNGAALRDVGGESFRLNGYTGTINLRLTSQITATPQTLMQSGVWINSTALAIPSYAAASQAHS